MNVENARLLVETVRAHKDQFYMGTWGERTQCGTAMCAAGWAAALAGDPPKIPDNGMADQTRSGKNISTVAGHWLELSYDESEQVFYSRVCDADELAALLTDVTGVSLDG
jgi:hypothetical protein